MMLNHNLNFSNVPLSNSHNLEFSSGATPPVEALFVPLAVILNMIRSNAVYGHAPSIEAIRKTKD